MCDDPDTCNGAGTCVPNYEPTTKTCGSTGTACTKQDYCNGSGGCTDNGFFPAGYTCAEDAFSCTKDECNGSGTCRHVPNDNLCSDSNLCDGQEICNPTSGCQEGTPPSCDDGVDCTTDSCTENACSNVPTGAACPDNNDCTQYNCVIPPDPPDPPDPLEELEDDLDAAEGADGLVTMTLTHPGNGGAKSSYIDATLSKAGALNGLYDDWCVDTDRTISPGASYQVTMTSTYDPASYGMVEWPQNLDRVNWLINRSRSFGAPVNFRATSRVVPGHRGGAGRHRAAGHHRRRRVAHHHRALRCRGTPGGTVAFERIAYATQPWQAGAHPLESKKLAALGRATLLRFSPGFADPNWCEGGHAGYVLEGSLRLELEDGAREVSAGEGFVVEQGTRHRAGNPGEIPVVLFLATYEASASAVSSSR